VGSKKKKFETVMHTQSFSTLATFIVSALVLPMSRYTAKFSAIAMAAFPRKTRLSHTQVAIGDTSASYSTAKKGTVRQRRQHGEI
jgi:hypothetical protein